MWSGDVVVRDEEGFLYFVGRRDEMIKTSGYRVSPTEIEEVAYDTGLVRDAVALGVEDDRLGQHVVLAVAPAASRSATNDLLARMRQQLPAVHGARSRARARRAATVAERQVRSRPAARRVDVVILDRTFAAAFGPTVARSRSVASRSSASPLASGRRRSSPTTAAAH